jgi:hypothetical protein
MRFENAPELVYSRSMRPSLLAPLALASLLQSLLVVGCSNDDDDAGKANCSLPAGAETASEDCLACVEASCSAEYSGYCAGGCGADMSSTACQQATASAVACILDECSDECASGYEAPIGGGNQPNFACYVDDEGLCSASVVAEGERATYEGACTDSEGVVSESCPAAGLVGCCSYRVGTTPCVYGVSPALDADICEQSSGSWSSKAP